MNNVNDQVSGTLPPTNLGVDTNPQREGEGTHEAGAETQATPKKYGASFMRHFGAMQPGGGLLNVYEMDPEDFGTIGAALLSNIDGATKRDRKIGFNDLARLLRGLRFIGKAEQLLTITTGVNSLGDRCLVVVTVIGGGKE